MQGMRVTDYTFSYLDPVWAGKFHAKVPLLVRGCNKIPELPFIQFNLSHHKHFISDEL